MSVEAIKGNPALLKNGAIQDFQTHAAGPYTVPLGVISGTIGMTPSIYTPNNYISESQTFAVDDFLGGGVWSGIATEQGQKLQWFMNMFEKYKLAKVSISFHPRYTVTNSTTNQFTTLGNTISAIASSSYELGNGSIDFFLNDAISIIMIHDDEDSIVRSVANEYMQAKMQDGRVEFLSTQHSDILIEPYITQSYDQDLDVGGFSATRPLKAPWLDTKVDTSGGITLNTYSQHYGLKIYLWQPYAFPITIDAVPGAFTNATQEFSIGYFSYTYYWSFMDLDNRAIITSTVYKEKIVTQTPEEIKKRQFYESIQWQPPAHPFKKHPALSKLHATVLRDEKRIVGIATNIIMPDTSSSSSSTIQPTKMNDSSNPPAKRRYLGMS